MNIKTDKEQQGTFDVLEIGAMEILDTSYSLIDKAYHHTAQCLTCGYLCEFRVDENPYSREDYRLPECPGCKKKREAAVAIVVDAALTHIESLTRETRR